MPAATAYITRVRTDIPAGCIQFPDLKPNTSQANGALEPVTQSGYLGPRAGNQTVGALSANATTATYTGLAAYLIAHVVDNVSNVTITPAVANAAAAAFIAQVDAGEALDVNAALVSDGGAGAATTLDADGSVGSLKEVLQILSGATYTLPAGSVVGALATASGLGSFDLSTYRQIYVTGALQLSCAEGSLAGFASSTFSYGGTTGRALVVYLADGSVLT